MAKYRIGDLISDLRKQLNITQDALAEGIMDRGALSRIESGKSMPSKLKLEAIFEKLGVNPNSLASIFVDNKMAETQKITDALDSCLASGNTEEASLLISQLEGDKAFGKDKLNMQHLLAAKAANAINMGEAPKIVLEMLESAMLITRQGKDYENRTEELFLTGKEIKILNMKATQHFELGEKDRAISILQGLINYIEKKCIDRIERGTHYPHIMYHLTMYLGKLAKYPDEYRKVITLCDMGIKGCLETRHLWFLPSLILNKAWCLCEIGDTDMGERLLRQSYHMCDAYEFYAEKKAIKSYAAEKLGIAL